MQQTIPDSNLEIELQDRVSRAVANGSPLQVIGGSSKVFYGNFVEAEKIEVSGHTGVIDYDPAELVITLRAGCNLAQVEALLAENNQMLGFEPLHLGASATMGGVIATGLAGPRRAYAGAVRDFILGVKLLSGRREIMNFGGRVIKNVAGFDVSRLMVGALGTLGVILEASLRVIPCFESEVTLAFEHTDGNSHIQWINELGSKPLPLSASCWYQGRSFVRLSGSQQGVESATARLGGEKEQDIWPRLRQQSHEFFTSNETILRLSLPSACMETVVPEAHLIEWGGAQRWLGGDTDVVNLREKVENLNASVCVYRGSDESEKFHPLDSAIMRLHRSLKSSFDPAGILNPGRLYREL
jgi:glycolate oxidase FAD binding subunit